LLRRLSLAVVVLVVAVLALLASARFWVQVSLDTPLAIAPEGRVLQVESGGSLSALTRQLAADGVISSPYPVLVHARVAGIRQIMAGDYQLSPGDTFRQLLDKLVAGDVIRFRITFPEGRSLREWLAIINDHDRLQDKPELDLATVAAEFRPPQGETLEGWFFPDTYTFSGRDDGLAILRQAHAAMTAVLAEEWQRRGPDLPIDTPYEALILASIIEKETGDPAERGVIAGVFARRLQLGMKLQTDPTVIYGLGESFDGNLTRTHLREENPFNTYFIRGLPPSPITNPGRDAIRAALHPEDGTALYFVARGDGSHVFSATLEEHNRAVRQYQLRRAEDYRSSPR